MLIQVHSCYATSATAVNMTQNTLIEHTADSHILYDSMTQCTKLYNIICCWSMVSVYIEKSLCKLYISLIDSGN